MVRQERNLFLLLFLSMFVIGLSKWRIDRVFEWRYPPLTDLVATEHYAEDIGALFLGAHRLAADLAYVQFLQYYGSAPEGVEEEEYPVEKGGEEHHHPHHGDLNGAGNYPRVKEFGLRLMMLDPYFNPPILEIAGALAFNLHKQVEATELLAEGIKRDPSFYRYRLYTAAILFKYVDKDKELINLLKQAIQYPDCPVILQNVLGNLLKKYGDFEGAAQVYLHTYQTAAFPYERDGAKTRLEELIREHPELKNFAILPADR